MICACHFPTLPSVLPEPGWWGGENTPAQGQRLQLGVGIGLGRGFPGFVHCKLGAHPSDPQLRLLAAPALQSCSCLEVRGLGPSLKTCSGGGRGSPASPLLEDQRLPREHLGSGVCGAGQWVALGPRCTQGPGQLEGSSPDLLCRACYLGLLVTCQEVCHSLVSERK